MAEKSGAHRISRQDLEQHLKKVNEHMSSIHRGGLEQPSLFELVKGIGGDQHLMAPEVQQNLQILRDGFSLYFEMYALLEDRVRLQPLAISDLEKQAFFGTYAMFAAGSFIAHELNLALGEQPSTPVEIQKKPEYFTLDAPKDNTLNLVLARHYGLVNTGKRNHIIVQPSDLTASNLAFYRFLVEEALAKKPTFQKDLVDLVTNTTFTVADRFTLSGFEVSFEETAKATVSFVPVHPHQVAGNVLAKKEMLRDMDRLALFDLSAKKNPILEVGGLSWSILYDGLPGTGKSSLFRMGLTRLHERCEQVSSFLQQRNQTPLKWKQLIIDQSVKDEYYGKTGKQLLALLAEARKTDGLYIVTTDDIDLLVSPDRNSSSGGADRDILNILMQYADGINTVIRGNTQWWAATNDATSMDGALRQRFLGRYEVDGPVTWQDFADITYEKLRPWITKGIIALPQGDGYTPFTARQGETGHEQKPSSLVQRGHITLADIGHLCEELKGKNPRFTGRAVHAVTQAVQKRVNDYDIPTAWYEQPDLFFFQPYERRVAMLQALCKKVTPEMIVQEFERYATSEQRYAEDKFESDVARGLHNARVYEAVQQRLKGNQKP